jgi:hypothetical protein
LQGRQYPLPPMNHKICSSCHEAKPSTQFTHDRTAQDHRHHRCLACERIRTRQRMRAGALPKAVARWRSRNPDAVNAHRLLKAAVKRGNLQRQPCCVCGSTVSHAHHEDYSRPLDVVWLCLHCHHERHRLERLFGPGQMAFELLLEEVSA